MKTLFALGWFCAAAGGVAAKDFAGAKPLTVHEWGTFTTVSGSDGELLPGLEREEHALPPFVYSHAGFSPATKGFTRPLANVTVKMETPVLYFYSAMPQTVDVRVGFNGGSISQWFPERSGGESLPAPLGLGGATLLVGEALEKLLTPLDFAKGYQGSAAWRVDVLAPGCVEENSVQRQWERPEIIKALPAIEHWQRARVAGANKVRGSKGEVEGFIFYRGVGNFSLPLKIKAGNERLLLTNSGPDAISFLLVYEKSPAFPRGVVRWNGPLQSGAREMVPLKSDHNPDATVALSQVFPRALEQAGLTAEEARAMIATWRESYFERDGLRVFWIVPRAFTDRVLPISISPEPEKLERVLVGRSEVLIPDFEQEFVRDFRADGGKRWLADRYYLAYLARARQLGVVLPAPRP